MPSSALSHVLRGLPFLARRFVARLLIAFLFVAAIASDAHAGRKASDPWTPTLDHVSRAVMALEVSGTRSLDTEPASASSGTGFIVDRERGILLTNRHMVHVGPVRAKGITLNHEEVPLYPLYRDPIHDYGFYRFDPAAIRYMELEELALAPEAAQVGVEIRVVGNDAGEKLSILGGTLARLDRPAPDYGVGEYNDFNTFYLQAATSTSGGSSGSPVVDVRGRVLALNAGGNRDAATSYYLPVDRVVRALAHLQRGEPIPRGTIQAVYRFEAYDELRRLGLSATTEAEVRRRNRDATGLLVVREVVPGGPSDGVLQPGDILLDVGGSPADDFGIVEDALDARVGGRVPVRVERGGTLLSVDVPVDDLHALTPSRFLEFSQAVVQETSLQLARAYNVPARGVLLVEPGYAFREARIWQYSVIVAMDDRPVASLADLVTALAGLPDGRRVRVRYHTLDNPRQEQATTLRVDRRWSPARVCTRNDGTGFWDCEDLPPPPAAQPEPPSQATATFEQVRDPVGAKVSPSLCHVRYTVPYRTEGIEGWSYIGAGLVVDTERGLVVTDRGTVPTTLGDVELTFAGSVRIPARVEFLHPVHNFAVLRYDPTRLGQVPVRPARLDGAASLDAGDTVHQVGLTSGLRVVTEATTITRVDPAGSASVSPPAFREYNAEVYKLTESASSIGGVLAWADGAVVALWAFGGGSSDSNSFYGLPIDVVEQVLPDLRAGRIPTIRDLGVEVEPTSLVDARDQGAPDTWVNRLTAADPERRQVLAVVRVAPGIPASTALRGGDLLLAVDGQPMTRPRQLEVALARGGATVKVTRLRDGAVEEVEISPITLQGLGVERVVGFAGALLHEPHWQVGLQHGLEGGGLYVAWYWYGGPAAQYGLEATGIVRAVNEAPVHTLDDFLAAVKGVGDGGAVRLQVENLQGVRDVTTLVTDLHYWPTTLLQHGADGWRLQALPAK